MATKELGRVIVILSICSNVHCKFYWCEGGYNRIIGVQRVYAFVALLPLSQSSWTDRWIFISTASKGLNAHVTSSLQWYLQSNLSMLALRLKLKHSGWCLRSLRNVTDVNPTWNSCHRKDLYVSLFSALYIFGPPGIGTLRIIFLKVYFHIAFWSHNNWPSITPGWSLVRLHWQ